ncbi:DUF1853 family protein [Rhodopirellula sp. P2]|uniref:DUF1853 family protein n=1 Tax=Rhodopirellula sp. P2 TaxID=2127060 RepID=UPI0023681E0F|nr:DUF1853 family protein [Rhodopirellula sp. P2]WDQ15098.1 DUF1853 family protein [Rhodopirellula sp. P2]
MVNSPSLISPSGEWLLLSPGQIDPQQLRLFMDRQASRKVGLYFERLMLYWLTHIRGVEMVAHALPVRMDGRTLGELDFLFVDERGRLTHWEVAVKFFLHLPDQPWQGSHFVGPNSNDSFERKTRRIFDHQLPLSHRVRDDVEIREAVVKGCLFYPPGGCPPSTLPPAMSVSHDRGSWVHRRDLDQVVDSDATFQILAKPFWLSVNAASAQEASWMTGDEFVLTVDQTLQEFDRPIFAVRWETPTGKITSESKVPHRFFVVPDHWPGKR